jgi:hypothetical protein
MPEIRKCWTVDEINEELDEAIARRTAAFFELQKTGEEIDRLLLARAIMANSAEDLGPLGGGCTLPKSGDDSGNGD